MAVARLGDLELVEEFGKALAILCQIDVFGSGAEDPDAPLFERQCHPQWGLPSELDDDSVWVLDIDDIEHILESERLEIQPRGGVVVGRYGLWVAVDHDRVIALITQRERRLTATVVELDALADSVRSAAQDQHPALAGVANLVILAVGRVEVRRVRLELGGAGVDPVVDRGDPLAPALIADRQRVGTQRDSDLGIAEAHDFRLS